MTSQDIFASTDELIRRAKGNGIKSHIYTALAHRLLVFKAWQDYIEFPFRASWPTPLAELMQNNDYRKIAEQIRRIEEALA